MRLDQVSTPHMVVHAYFQLRPAICAFMDVLNFQLEVSSAARRDMPKDGNQKPWLAEQQPL